MSFHDFADIMIVRFRFRNEYDRTGGHNICYLRQTIPNTEQKFVYCAIWRTMILIEAFNLFNHINKAVTVSRLQLHIFHPGGGGGTPLYRLYRYVRSQRVWFFGCVGHK